jgi:F0F1-type ATP synthase alpha subunit
LDIDKISRFEEIIYAKMDTSYKSLTNLIIEKQELSPEIEEQIKNIIQESLSELK